MTIAAKLGIRVLRPAGSNIVPGSSGPRASHGSSAPMTSAPANWKRLRIRIDPAPTRDTRSWRITPSCPELVEGSQRPPVDPGIEGPVAPHVLQVGQRSPRRHHPRDPLVWQFAIVTVGDGADDEVIALAVQLGQLEPVLTLDLGGIGQRVGNRDVVAQPL